VLTILGLPALACTKQAQTTGDGETTVLEIPAVSSALPSASAPEDELDEELFTHPAARAFDCGPNRTRAIVCGRMYGDPPKPAQRPYERCSETAHNVSHEVLVGRHPHPAGLDTALTARYRKHKKNDEKSCCYSQCVDVETVAKAAPLPSGYRTRLECITAIRRGVTHPADGRSDCPAAVDFGSGPDRHYAAPFHEQNTDWRTKWVRERTGFEDINLCCYQNAINRPMIRRGRALRDGQGGFLVPPTTDNEDWAAALPELDFTSMPATTRRALADRWAKDAELEHASVASFSQLSLALLAAGAPPRLVAEAHEAALDEIRHAEICYALASGYGGRSLGPGPLPVPPMASGDPVALAVETFIDGCVGETAAALVAAMSADGCEHPTVARALREIAEDEQRHAELAWRILRWTLGFEGVKEAIAAECERLRDEVAAPPVEDGPLACHGVLSVDAEGAIRHRAIFEVVLPCTEALVAAT
jgi:hypothetical protein